MVVLGLRQLKKHIKKNNHLLISIKNHKENILGISVQEDKTHFIRMIHNKVIKIHNKT